MSYSIKSKTSKLVAGVLGFAMVVSFVFGGAIAPAQAQTVADLTAQINSLLSTITQLQAQLAALQGGGSGTGTVGTGFTFTRNLSQGDTGEDVRQLQIALNADGVNIATTGAGSPGNETSYFGSLTKAGVVRFQNKYASEILAPVGLINGTGFVGPSTRAKLNQLTAGTGTPGTGTPGTGVPGASLTVSPGAQPTSNLVPADAARVPFTRVVLTAGASAVTVNSITVERTGLATDSIFTGVVLLDESGNQIGISKTLNSNHQTTIGDPFTIPAGTSRTVTVAANTTSQAAMANLAGQVVSFTVVGINTTGAVAGSLPITGASHITNASLDLGSATAARGALDPNSSQTRDVGTTGYTFSSVKITAGSQEDIRLNSVRFNQSGSAAASDLANVQIVVDGTAYTPTVSSDGKYYTASFGSGIVINKGLSKDISIRGDVVSGSGRTVAFDVYKLTDINVSGELYGFGILPTVGSGFSATSPVFDASVVTISGGSITVSKANSVVAQNVAINVPNQPLGGVTVKTDGESISVQSMVFNVLVTGAEAADLTNVVLVDANGAVVAGPVDGSGAAQHGTITFTDTVTFPVGENTYTLQGQLGTDIVSNDTIVASTTPSTQWTSATGQTTGNSITPSPASAITLNTMTAKAAAAAISVSGVPNASTVVAGAQDFTFANILIDATTAGEDIRFNALKFSLSGTGTASHLTGCTLFDGMNALNSGSNIPNPTASGSNTVNLDGSGLTVAKGTSKTVAVKCDVSTAAATSDTFAIGVPAASNQSAVGLTSGTSAALTGSAATGPTMTVAAGGSLTFTEDASSPAYRVVPAGATNVTVGVIRFDATNESVDLNQVALELSNGSATSSPSNVTKVTLWDGTTQVGEANFGNSRFATSTLNLADFIIPANGNKKLTVKADLAGIGLGSLDATSTSGILIQVDIDGDDEETTKGIGQGSGSTVTATGSDSTVEGVRVMNTVPTFAHVSVPSTVLTNGTKVLYRFSVTADSAADVGIHKFTFNVATTGATITGMNVWGYTTSGFNSPVPNGNSGKLDGDADHTSAQGGIVEVYAENSSGTSIPLTVPAGNTYYFELTGTVVTDGSDDSVVTQLEGDAAFPTAIANLMGTAAGVEGDTHDDFIWSPNSTTTSTVNNVDWTNGYGVPGLPTNNMSQSVLSN